MNYYKKKATTIVDLSWQKRIEDVIDSLDNREIERVDNAGEIKGDVQIMHNGIRIHVGSYYGDGMTALVHKNRGVHEPEEEKCFSKVLTYMPEGAIMLELGAFWGFYSMSFQQGVKNACNYLIEPDRHAILSGMNNFRLNGFKGRFFRYNISDRIEAGDTPSITVDSFLKEQAILNVNILHSDIQGFEEKMLMGAVESLTNRMIDYVFISTHSHALHLRCKSILIGHKYRVLCDSNLDETYSWDGLIVARREELNGPDQLVIHKRV
ncbi:MAG TPA: FkbM family methyltransferase [Chryseolinea sp.]|nr:FkbM family methyltransferase [Chryseolinea sp.]